MISSTNNEDMSSGNDEQEIQRQSRRQQEAKKIFAMHCKNFARIAKISQGLQKFRNRSENFGKRNLRCAQNLAKLAKFRYHSESYCA